MTACDPLRSSSTPLSGRQRSPGRVEDWRAGVGRSLCSPLTRPFVCECHSISTVPRFQPPLIEPNVRS